MNSEPKAFASLSSGLLARKGSARPAMRPQGFGEPGSGLEDLGWNDMGFDPSPPVNDTEEQNGHEEGSIEQFSAHHKRNPLSALTPASSLEDEDNGEEDFEGDEGQPSLPGAEDGFSPVHDQQEELLKAFAVPEGEEHADGEDYVDETAEMYEPDEDEMASIYGAADDEDDDAIFGETEEIDEPVAEEAAEDETVAETDEDNAGKVPFAIAEEDEAEAAAKARDDEEDEDDLAFGAVEDIVASDETDDEDEGELAEVDDAFELSDIFREEDEDEDEDDNGMDDAASDIAQLAASAELSSDAYLKRTVADIVPIPARPAETPEQSNDDRPEPKRAATPRATTGSKDKAAFTLRLDKERHLKLRLACAVNGQSAQKLVTKALDAWLADMPELEALANKAPEAGKRASN